MFEFLKNQWILGKINEEFLKLQVEKKRITQEQYEMIVVEETIS